MNSLAALSRAFSKSASAGTSREASQAVDALAQELAHYGLPSAPETPPLTADGAPSPKSPDAQATEEHEDASPASAYPSPPPTPELPSEATPLRSTLPQLARQLSKKRGESEAAMVDRAARSLPVRLTVAVYMLVRRMLRLMGIKIAEPPMLNRVEPLTIELQVTPPSPTRDAPPPYEAVDKKVDEVRRWPRPKLSFLRGATSSTVSSPSTSRRSSVSTALPPSNGWSAH